MDASAHEPTRLALPLSPEGYAAANEAFRRCWQQDRTEVLAFFAQHLPAFDDTTATVLGIGVGDGEFDMQLLAQLRTHIGNTPVRYVAVEPNDAQLDGFRRRVDGTIILNTTFTFVPERAEDYRPDAAFNLIHYIHSLYHMPKSEERLIQESRSWLQSGGTIVIALSSEQGGIYQMMSQFWNRIDYSFFTSGLFGQESLRAILDRNAIPYACELYPDVAIDVTTCFDPASTLGQDLLDFLLQADIHHAPADLRHDILAALDSLARTDGERQLLSHPSGVFVIGGEAEKR